MTFDLQTITNIYQQLVDANSTNLFYKYAGEGKRWNLDCFHLLQTKTCAASVCEVLALRCADYMYM